MFALNFSSSSLPPFLAKTTKFNQCGILVVLLLLNFLLTTFYTLPPPPRDRERWEQTRKLWSNLVCVCVCVCNSEGISFLTSIKSKKKYFIDETCFLKFMLMKNKLAADVIHILLGYLKRFYCICHVLREIFFWCEWCP